MPKYYFYQDSQVRTTERTHFSIAADDYRAAIDRIMSFKEHDVDNHSTDKDVEYCEQIHFFESSEKLSPDQNEGRTTISIFDKDYDQLILQNVPVKLQSIKSVPAPAKQTSFYAFIIPSSMGRDCTDQEILRKYEESYDGKSPIERYTLDELAAIFNDGDLYSWDCYLRFIACPK